MMGESRDDGYIMVEVPMYPTRPLDRRRCPPGDRDCTCNFAKFCLKYHDDGSRVKYRKPQTPEITMSEPELRDMLLQGTVVLRSSSNHGSSVEVEFDARVPKNVPRDFADALTEIASRSPAQPEGVTVTQLARRLLTTVHQPAPEAKPDYWHVARGRHVEFGIVVSALVAALRSKP
jgi:hypothetical protein